MTVTIVSGGNYDLSSPLGGSPIEFLNSPSISGVLTIETSAIENITANSGGGTIITTGFGGLIENFQSGDTIVVRDLATDYAFFDHSPNSLAQNQQVSTDLSTILFVEGFLGDEVITLSASGTVTDNTGLLEGRSIFGVKLAGTVISEIDSYASALAVAAFSTAAQTADLYITIAPDATNSSLADAIMTTNGTFVICYLRGTRILTENGEVAVEALRPGDLVVSKSGGLRAIKFIGTQAYGARFVAGNRDRLPVKIAAGALGEAMPLRDLYVSPGHSVLLGETLVLARDLVNGVSITQEWRTEDTHYYSIELETHDCVLAEGAWAESYADAPGLRNQFHNAAAFYAAFPDYVEPEAITLCAPRPQEGQALAAALRPVLARTRVTPGALRGYVEEIGEMMTGWALDEAHPEFPVSLAIYAGDEKLGEVLACAYRGDLAQAGLGGGRCLFSFPLTGVSAPARAMLRVERLEDGAALPRAHACKVAA